jgi:hypothetical protein
MKPLARNLAVIAVAALAFAPAGARAQWYSSYSQPAPQRPYAVGIAPDTYVIRRPAASRPRAAMHRHVRRAARKARARVHNDPALIEELRRRHARHMAKKQMAKQERRHRRHKVDRTVTVKGKVRVVRGKPRVVVRTRVVDDPPRVIVRPHLIDKMPRKRGLFALPPERIVRDLPPYVEQGPAMLSRSWHPEPNHREPRAVRHTARRKPHRHTTRHKPARHKAPPAASHKATARRAGADERTIKAEAEVTILGPDRMMIRLYRKGDAPPARAN